jgi:hypothetical protein
MKHKTEKIDNIIKINIQKCVKWCIKYNIPCNPLLLAHYNIHLENTSLIKYSQINKKCVLY